MTPQFLEDYPFTDDDYQDYYDYNFSDQADALAQSLDAVG